VTVSQKDTGKRYGSFTYKILLTENTAVEMTVSQTAARTNKFGTAYSGMHPIYKNMVVPENDHYPY
tara:strand:- start:200 stop:397 length:198 start_codon:yes stop_codon:yes gene_type:complete